MQHVRQEHAQLKEPLKPGATNTKTCWKDLLILLKAIDLFFKLMIFKLIDLTIFVFITDKFIYIIYLYMIGFFFIPFLSFAVKIIIRSVAYLYM